MPDKFEKEIQTNLKRLKISPTDSVWSGVEQELDKKERHRRIIWRVALPIGLFFFLGVLYFNASDRHDKGDFESEPDVIVQPSQLEREQVTAPLSKRENDSKEDTTISEDQLKKEPSTGENMTIYPGIISSEKKVEQGKGFNKLHGQAEMQNSDNTLLTRMVTGKIPSLQLRDDLCMSDSNLVLSEKAPLLNPNPLASEATSLATTSDRSGWKFGLSFSPGISFLSMKSNQLSNSSRALSSPNFSMNPGTGDLNSSSAFRPWVGEPKYHPGFSYVIGLSAKHMLGRRWGLTSGMNFRHISLSHTSSAIMQYMSAASSEKWIDKFNFIEIPVLLSYQSDLGKIKINWEGGIVYSRLLSADAWQYDTSLKVFNNHVVLNKNQIGLQGGAALEFLSNKKIGFEVGPYFQYSLSKSGKGSALEPRHFNSGGIQMRVFLKK